MGTFYNHLNTKQISDIDPISRFLKLKKYCYKCNKMFDLAEILRVVRGVVLSLLMNLSEGPMDMSGKNQHGPIMFTGTPGLKVQRPIR